MKYLILTCIITIASFSFTSCASDEHRSTSYESSTTMQSQDNKSIHHRNQ